MNKNHSALIVGLTSITFFTGCVVFTNISDSRERSVASSTITSEFQLNPDLRLQNPLGKLTTGLALPSVPLYTPASTPAEKPVQPPAPIELPSVQALQQEVAVPVNLPPAQPLEPPVIYRQETMQPTTPGPDAVPPPSVSFVPSPIPPSAPPVSTPAPAKQKTTRTRAS